MTDPIEKKRNRFTPIYALAAALLLVFLGAFNELDMALNLWVLIIPFMLIPTAIVFIWLVIAFVIHALWRRWRRVASILLGPPVGLAGVMIAFEAGFDATWMRFEATKSRYVQEIDEATSPRFKAWQWGETGGPGTVSSFFTLVFDETDEIAEIEPGRHVWDKNSPSVLSGAVAENDDAPWISVRHVEGHFYLVREDY